MGLKWLLGGEVNHKFIEKQKQKNIEFEKELDSGVLKKWKQSNQSIEYKINKLIKNWEESDLDFPRRFLLRHPELLNSDQKVYAAIILPTMPEDDKDKNCNNFFFKSNSNLEYKINNILKASAKSKDKDFARRFFFRHPELVPTELNPFIKKQNNTEDMLNKKQRYINELIDWNKDLQEENQNLINENKQLKQKIKNYEHIQ